MSTAAQQSSSHPNVDGKFIYIVDDEKTIGDLVQTILRRAGYNTKFFSNPELALSSFMQEEPPPTLLLTDYLMAPINGLDLIDRCKRHRPALRTILFSGNASESVLEGCATMPDGFLHKPFLPKVLLGMVQRVVQ